jgi:DNA-binding NtrC family response regulator
MGKMAGRKSVTGSGWVVDDDLDLYNIFERVAYQVDPKLGVDWAMSVSEAVEKIEERHYDLVVCDYMLDEKASGFALRGWMEREHAELPFAMMSSLHIDRYLQFSGPRPSPFLSKPFSISGCRDFLASMLGFRGRRTR